MKNSVKTIIGLVVFYGVFNLFFKTGTFSSAIPSALFFIIIGAFVSLYKKGNSGKQKKDSPISELKVEENEKKQSTEKDPYSIERTSFSKRCCKCNALISSDDSYCPECGASQKQTIICEYCGHENPASNALCEKCNGFL